MERTLAAANSSTLIFIAKLNLFGLAKNMFKQIIVPEQVVKELFQKESSENYLIESEIGKFLKKTRADKVRELVLGEGESSAISYCLEHNLKTFLSDDKKARTIADSLGLETKGILGILLWNLEHKYIKKEKCLELVNKLIEIGYYMEQEIYIEIMRKIEEAEQ